MTATFMVSKAPFETGWILSPIVAEDAKSSDSGYTLLLEVGFFCKFRYNRGTHLLGNFSCLLTPTFFDPSRDRFQFTYQTQPGHHSQGVVGHIDFSFEKPLPSRAWEEVMVIVPALPKS